MCVLNDTCMLTNMMLSQAFIWNVNVFFEGSILSTSLWLQLQFPATQLTLLLQLKRHILIISFFFYRAVYSLVKTSMYRKLNGATPQI